MPVTRNTIIAKSYLNIRDERTAGGAITPGHLVQQDADGDVTVHASADGTVQKMFAVEDSYQGYDIDHAYADQEKCFLWLPTAGDRVYAIAGDTITVGAFLTSFGNGTLHVAVPHTEVDSRVGVALEAAAAGERFLVEII